MGHKKRTDIEVIIEPLSAGDLKKITKKRYFFNWKKDLEKALLYKLRIKDDNDIKGVMALVDYPHESRIEIQLLAASAENVILEHEKGEKQKDYENIAGNLIAWAARMAIAKYGINACLSLKPKTKLKSHYLAEYGMLDAGLHVFLEGSSLHTIIANYIL